MLSSQEEEQERRETLENDRKVREQQQRDRASRGSTFHQHAQAAASDNAGGRFGSVNSATVVGSQPLSKYPELPSSSPWSSADPVPIEPPLGYDINKLSAHEIEPSLTTPGLELAAQDTGDPVSDAPHGYETGPPESAVSDSAAGSSSSPEQSDDAA